MTFLWNEAIIVEVCYFFEYLKWNVWACVYLNVKYVPSKHHYFIAWIKQTSRFLLLLLRKKGNETSSIELMDSFFLFDSRTGIIRTLDVIESFEMSKNKKKRYYEWWLLWLLHQFKIFLFGTRTRVSFSAWHKFCPEMVIKNYYWRNDEKVFL